MNGLETALFELLIKCRVELEKHQFVYSEDEVQDNNEEVQALLLEIDTFLEDNE